MDSLEAHSPGLSHRNPPAALRLCSLVLGQTSQLQSHQACVLEEASRHLWVGLAGWAVVLGGARAAVGGVAAVGGASGLHWCSEVTLPERRLSCSRSWCSDPKQVLAVLAAVSLYRAQ